MSLMHDVKCAQVFGKVSSLSLICFQFLAPGMGLKLIGLLMWCVFASITICPPLRGLQAQLRAPRVEQTTRFTIAWQKWEGSLEPQTLNLLTS